MLFFIPPQAEQGAFSWRILRHLIFLGRFGFGLLSVGLVGSFGLIGSASDFRFFLLLIASNSARFRLGLINNSANLSGSIFSTFADFSGLFWTLDFWLFARSGY